ncbi:MAG: Stk1 family PASTA domain-containing Ser/Thr kinase [Actinobacteria bacterium]|nr:Stk1 family PASTA domain-containing Ser/Thr kinase [Actinomycetota bacterium]MCB8996996.1 Stk1 family PASTA domain-containing Ser/Thr kinase [Actinomycetota bacterium]MCB9414013.1 Stk1 family PASTA domain-containing Ser/Thr kinase [Actinomycetota bacterium]MCB9424522.1 Stk1 family PASTA domain-containing Ser/Thr kinase [Actinomycetota bacterium]HRY08634.1 Stk1 family PASTA domain-containing Ser/Thr kinase [Candidatus Nanopelagicales bacterium]
MTTSRRLGDRYELGDTLGRGGMAEVFEGQDLRLNRRVAVKVLRPDLARDPAFQSRFRREAQSAASLNDPNIVAVYDTGEDVLDGGGEHVMVPYIVMEYVDGHTLRELMSSGRRLLPERSLEIMAGVLSALDYSHAHGIIHRDIKPGNVMLNRNGDVKVMDFGIARAVADAQATMTQGNAVMGTAQYLSPEQARGEVVDARSDLYSAGCLFYELLTGRPPFQGESAVSVAYQHVSETPVPPSQVDPAVPSALDPMVLKSLAKNPEDRYQSANEFKADVERAMAGLPVTGTIPTLRATVPATANTAAMQPVPAGDPAQPANSKRSPWAWLGVTLLVLGVAAAALFLGRSLFDTGSGERVTVPDVVGMTIDEAQRALESQGLKLGSQTPQTSDEPEDTVLSQNPQADTRLSVGEAVTVTVSAGKQQTQVPPLEGLTNLDDVRTALKDAKLELGNVKQVESGEPEGLVLNQDPAAFTTVDVGSKVNIEVSTGVVEVPGVIGFTQSAATSALSRAGLDVRVVTASSDQPSGTVTNQDPAEGSQVKKGTTVTITVSSGPAPTQPPTPTETPTPSGEVTQAP